MRRRKTFLNHPTAKTRKTIFYNPGLKDAQIKSQLEKQGVSTTLSAIKAMRYRMRKEGIAVDKKFKTNLCKKILAKDPSLTTRAVVAWLKEFGVSAYNVRTARRQLGQEAPRQIRLKPYPPLTHEHHRLIRESLPILKRLIRIKTMGAGYSREYMEEAFLEISSKLPHWIPKKKKGASLEAFLNFKVKYELRSFKVKVIMQISGLKQKEVRQGLKWLRELHYGKSIARIAKEYGVDPVAVEEITGALKLVFHRKNRIF